MFGFVCFVTKVVIHIKEALKRAVKFNVKPNSAWLCF